MVVDPKDARILIVGADASLVGGLYDLLAAAGFRRVHGAAGHAAALRAAASEHPDLILVRTERGDAAGAQLLKDIEGLERERFVAVMVVDSLGDPTEILRQADSLPARRLLYRELNDEKERIEANAKQRSAKYEAAIAALEATQKRLESEIDSAEDRSGAKSEFIANLSHEFRTPLNAIVGFSDILKNETFGPHTSPKYREYANDIHVAAHHLVSLVNDVLDISRAEAGQLDLDFEEVDARATIDATVRILHDRARAKGLTLRVDIAPDFPKLRTDERRLRQVLINIVGNAIKFTPPSGSVLIKAGVDPVDGAFVIVVSDTGIGIDPADLPLVMSRYGQVRGSQPNPEAGTGLGLPLTQKIVHALGGTLEVRSRSRIGTAVTLRFPATLIVPPDAAKPLRKATRR